MLDLIVQPEVLDPKRDHRGEIEWRVSAIYIRSPDAQAIYPVSPDDVQDTMSRRIIKAVQDVVAANQKINVVNIRDMGTIPEEELQKRLRDYKPSWATDMPDYVARIQAEGYRDRNLRAHRDEYDVLAQCAWREVERVHAAGVQRLISIQVGVSYGEASDVGNIFEQITAKPLEDYAPLPTPWPWVNANFNGGLFPYKKYVFGGPPGQRKTSALFSLIHHMVMVLGKRWIHFPFDGGSVPDQTLKFAVMHWVHLLQQANVPLTCTADVLHGGSQVAKVHDYMYANTQVAYRLIYGEPTGCDIPRAGLEIFEQTRHDMRQLKRGQGKGLLVMVSPKEVGGQVLGVVQRLRNEMYGGDGLDGWSLDHVAKPENEFADEMQSIPRNTKVLNGFVDMEGPPCVLISHLNGEGNKDIGKKTNTQPGFRYNPQLHQDADGEFLFQYDDLQPGRVLLINQKNRDGRGGPNIKYWLRVEPNSGLIWDDPAFAKAQTVTQKERRPRKKIERDYDDPNNE